MINKRPCDECSRYRFQEGADCFRRCGRYREWLRLEWAAATEHAKEYLKARKEKNSDEKAENLQ